VIPVLDSHRETSESARPISGLSQLGRLVLRHKRLVALSWLAVAVVGVVLAGPIAGRFTSSENLPGLPSYEAGLRILRTYGTGGNNSPVIAIASLPPGVSGSSPAGARVLASTFSPLFADSQLRVVADPTAHDSRLLSANGRSALALIFEGDSGPSSAQIAARLRADAPPGVRVDATRLTDLYGAPGSSHGVGVLGEVVIGSVGALAVMIFVFGSFLAVVPLVVAFVSILGTYLALGAITTVTGVSQLVQYIVALIGLGVAIDYSLLVVTRWREEKSRGRPNDEAIIVAMSTAGRAVAFSGVTVAVGLFSLVALPIPFLRSLGYGGLLVPLVTVVTAMTLLPVLLSSWGPRLDRRGQRRASAAGWGQGERTGRAWKAWTLGVIRHRLAAIGAGLLILGVLLGAASQLHVGEIVPTSVARNGSAETGLRTLQQDGFPIGVLQPIEILVSDRTAATGLAARLRALPGVDTVLAPTGPTWQRDGSALVEVLPFAPTSSKSAETTVASVRALVARTVPGSLVAGDGPEEADIDHAFYSRFPLIVAVVALVSFLALARAFRALVLPLKAVLFNVLSVGAAYGALVLMWQDGYGSRAIWGIPSTGVVLDFVPLTVFAFLFGLSMDYEVFILSRIKEARDSGLSTDEAIVEGLRRTGRLVTSAAIILFLAFAALAAGPGVQVKVFATAMAVGILVDATVIRSLLVPATISLLGDRAWWPAARGHPAAGARV
jgi:putative drug exporter of the RND superfamily